MHDERPDALRVHLWPKQWTAFLTEATEVLFGGAAGPGKSHLMRVAAIVWCCAISGLQVYLFRRVREDLYKNHLEGPKGFRAMLAPLVLGGWCRIIGDEIRFWNGSRIYLCHCKAEADVYKYQGAEIHVLLIDELTHFSESQYRFLRNRVRMVGVTLPPEYVGKFPRILCGSNPGNTGHLWVKTTFITGTMPLAIRKMPPSEGGMLRQFIPARLDDNPSMAKDDPSYMDRLSGLGSASLVKAMRDGDWDVVEGAFFDEWSNHQHVLAPFTLPRHWLRFRSGDWGSYSPYSIGWWAVVGDDYHLRANASDAGQAAEYQRSARVLPRGALIRYREDYGAKGGKLTAEQVGQRIARLEKNDPKLAYAVLDPATFKEDGGPSIAERINAVLLKEKLIPFHEADNTRVSQASSRDRGGPMSGWDLVRSRLIGTAKRSEDEHGGVGGVDWTTGRPMLYVFSTCTDFIRTVPVLQHDKARPEDLDTTGEDHAADDGRYACASRPWVKSLTPAQKESRDAYAESREERYTDDTATL